ncbi:MAG: WYL domain-containing protein, partial [Lachnospiraceae bacterium]|nr:WYL domain-containing protein [Lachnospiraceae bacterium]
MAKSENQKLKLTALTNILLRLSDEKHQLTMSEILSNLEKEGISAERKSIYNDLRTLEEQGMDIVQASKGKYYVASRNYELAELKVLVDV